MIVMVGLARAFQKSKLDGTSTLIWAKSLSKGSLISTIVLVSMNLFGLITCITLIAAIIAIPIFRNYKISLDVDGISYWVVDNIQGLLKTHKIKENL